ncbi:HAD-IIIC family phosphatase, partial [Pseudomonadota bacterium]
MDHVLALLGVNNFYESRYWNIGKAPYSKNALIQLAKQSAKFIRAIKGKSYKCLVLDCDDTLWGGIIGEDGLEGIKLGPDYPGASFMELQRAVLNLYHRGIILAICSKNNHEDVLSVFESHPFMMLKQEHITIFKVNWDHKAQCLSEIAEELNIGIDSLIFVDDNPFEIEFVNKELPEVLTIQLPKQSPHLYASTLMTYAEFDTLSYSAEDRERSRMYQNEIQREKQKKPLNLEDYLTSLEMKLSFELGEPANQSRLSQLTLKTNQFNLTTRRYTDDDVHSFINSQDTDIIALRLSDKFGDYGIIGVCILFYETDKAVIDTFLMSCRVLSRSVEKEFLLEVLEYCRKKGCYTVESEYIQTKKNDQVKSFYEDNDFTKLFTDDTSTKYVFDLLRFPNLQRQRYFEIENSLLTGN